MLSLFVRRLTIIDFALLDSQLGLLGESWLVDIQMTGQLDQQGMLFDFGPLKKQCKAFIEQHYDHKLVVATRDKQLKITQNPGQISLSYQYQQKTLIHQSPPSAVTLVDETQITPEIIEAKLSQELMSLMPKNVTEIKLQLYPETTESGLFYQYSHGLKKHQGDCQRIAHGHRSGLQIYCDGKRDIAQEKAWVKKWQGIYIGTREDCLNPGAKQLEFAYQATQGAFKLSLPAVDCCLIETESTVENIAQFIANTLKKQHPEKCYQVRAFEGVDKGAIAVK